MKTGQPKNIRIWEDKTCFGDTVYLEYLPNKKHHYQFRAEGTLFVSQTSLHGISEELRRFYGERDTNN